MFGKEKYSPEKHGVIRTLEETRLDIVTGGIGGEQFIQAIEKLVTALAQQRLKNRERAVTEEARWLLVEYQTLLKNAEDALQELTTFKNENLGKINKYKDEK